MDSANPSAVSFRRTSAALVRRTVAVLALGLAGLAPALAADATDDTTIFTPGSPRTGAPAASGGGFGSVSLVLGLALAGAGGWLLWRQRRGASPGRDVRALGIDETRSLGNRQFLVIASYEGRKFLLGVCPGRIDLLTALDGPAPKEKGRE